jgi:hypothetical protein
MRRITLIGRLAVAAVVACAALISPAHATPSLTALAKLDIRPTDVPPVVALRKAWKLTPTLADYINVLPHGTSAKQGIVAGHAEFYECTAPAVCLFSTEIYFFKVQDAAHAWYHDQAVMDEGPGAVDPSQVTLALPPFGNERSGSSVMGPKFPLSDILFRSGHYAVRLRLQSPTSILSMPKLTHLAGIINTNIQHAR